MKKITFLIVILLCLGLMNSCKKSSSAIDVIATQKPMPKAYFTFSNTDTWNKNGKFNFFDSSINTKSYTIRYGDGISKSSDYFSDLSDHAYSSSGNYNVTLIAFNANGSDSIVKPIIVPRFKAFFTAWSYVYLVVNNPITVKLTSPTLGTYTKTIFEDYAFVGDCSNYYGCAQFDIPAGIYTATYTCNWSNWVSQIVNLQVGSCNYQELY